MVGANFSKQEMMDCTKATSSSTERTVTPKKMPFQKGNYSGQPFLYK